jgi:hypothetical protein
MQRRIAASDTAGGDEVGGGYLRIKHRSKDPEIVRTAVAYCVTIALLGMASEVALLHCPFLVASKHPPCCPAPNTPKKCPLSPSFETFPYRASDGKIEQAKKTLGAPPPAIGFTVAILPSSRS